MTETTMVPGVPGAPQQIGQVPQEPATEPVNEVTQVLEDESITESIDIDAMDDEIDFDLKCNVTVAIQTDVLKKLIGKVEKTVKTTVAIDIFKSIYLEFHETKIIARAINSDYTTEAFVEQNEEKTNFKIAAGKPGAVCFPAKMFTAIIKKLSHKDTLLTIESNNAIIKSGRPKFELLGLDGSEFPKTPTLGEGEQISIHSSVLSNLYHRTMYATSGSETRPILTGVHHNIEENVLHCIGTDGTRLSQAIYELDGNNPDVKGTIPSEILKEVKRHLDESEAEVILHFHSNQIVFEFLDVNIYARLLEGQYPPTQRLVFATASAGTTFTLNAGAIKSAITNALVYAVGDAPPPIMVRIKSELNQMRVTMNSKEVGAFEEDIALNNGQGEDIIVALNIKYMNDAFSRYNNEDTIIMEFMPSKEGKPAGMQPLKIRLKGGDGETLELLVPVSTAMTQLASKVVIDDFKGVPEFDFNPFEDDFAEVE